MGIAIANVVTQKVYLGSDGESSEEEEGRRTLTAVYMHGKRYDRVVELVLSHGVTITRLAPIAGEGTSYLSFRGP